MKTNEQMIGYNCFF